MLASTNEVQNGEIFLSFEESRPTPDNLFKLDHGIDGTHEDNGSDIARIHSCRKLLRCRENRRNGLFVILKLPQKFLSSCPIIRGHTDAVVWIFVLLLLINQITHGSRMVLIGAKHNRF